MKEKDKIIRETLLSKMEKIEDERFTERVVHLYLQSKSGLVKKTSFDFISLIIGLIFTAISIGLGVLVTADIKIGLTMQEVGILCLISVTYLIYRILIEILIPKMSLPDSAVPSSVRFGRRR
jgi:hypothetical protein